MGNRKRDEKHAIELSKTYTDNAPERPQRRSKRATALYVSWGGDDCLFFFRQAHAEIGFRGQSFEPRAETKLEGRRQVPLWNHSPGDIARVQKNIAALDVVIAKAEAAGREHARANAKRFALHVQLAKALMVGEGGDARPHSVAGTRNGCANPERWTDENLAASKRYGRVAAGMVKLTSTDAKSYAVLEAVFLPMPVAPEIRTAFGAHYAWLARSLPRVQKAWLAACEKEPVSLETWLLRRIERGDALVGLAREEAEAMAVAAVKAYEGCADVPPDIERAAREKKEDAERLSRAPRKSIADDFAPAGWGR